MFGSKPPRTIESVLAHLAKKHGKLLKPGEFFVATADTFAVDQAHPLPIGNGHKASDFETIRADDQLRRDADAHLRVNNVRSVLGMENQEFTELPASSTGYLLAHTNQRLFIFDGPGKTYLLQAPIEGLWLQPVAHGEGLYTLVFSNSDERVAVATRSESQEMTKHFIESFPDRRGQARVVSLVSRPNDIVEF